MLTRNHSVRRRNPCPLGMVRKAVLLERESAHRFSFERCPHNEMKGRSYEQIQATCRTRYGIANITLSGREMSVSSDEGEGEKGGGVELPGTGPAVGVRGGGVERAGGSRPCIGADAAQEFDFRILGADGNASGNECSAGNGKLTDPACISFNRSPHTRSTQPSTRRQTRFRLIGRADGTRGDGSSAARAFGC